jgi:hypothetical protein
MYNPEDSSEQIQATLPKNIKAIAQINNETFWKGVT